MRIKILGFLVVLLFSLVTSTTVVGAKEVTPSATPSLSPSPTPIEYSLPYPGILPGHPLFFLKSIRDNLMSFLISNPLKKAEFYLLQADKNLQSVVYLLEQNKDKKIVFQTLEKSEDYFEKAVEKTKEAKKQGIYTADFVAKITIANLKHQEIISNLLKSAKGEGKKVFEISLEKLKNFEKNLKTLNLK